METRQPEAALRPEDAVRPRLAGWRAEAQATLALSWPIALTNLSQFALTLTDVLILGWLGTTPLAAATLGANLYWAVIAPAFGLALAAAPLLAQARGAGRRGGGAGRGWVREMRRDARQAMWAVAVLTVPAWAILWHAEGILLVLGQDPALAAAAGSYVRALMWGLPAFCGFIVLRGFLAAMERPGPALWVSAAAVLINAVLDWVLVFGAWGWNGLGVVGAGVASSFANLVMLVSLLLVVGRDRQLRRFHLLGRLWRPDPVRLREVFRVGLPIAGTLLLEIGVFASAALLMGRFGAVAVAAHAIAVQVASMTFMVPMGIGQAATARVGIAIGAGDSQGVTRAGWVAVGLGAGFMAAMALLLVLAAGPLAWAFLDPADPQAAEAAMLGAALLIVAGVFQLADGVQAVAAGALRGLKDTRVPMLVAGLGYWGIGLPAGLALAWPFGFGPVGVWLGLALGLGIVAVLLLRRWRALSHRMARAASPAPAWARAVSPRPAE